MFSGLLDISPLIEQLMWQDILPDANSPLSLLDIMIDLFYHLKYAFPTLQKTLFSDKVQAIVKQLAPELKAKLKYLFH